MKNELSIQKIQKKIINFLKEPILYLIIAIIIIQTIVYSKIPNGIIQADSASYIYNYNKESIFNGYVNNVRTPVYPYFIKVIKRIGGEANLSNNIAITQKILFLISIIFIYCTLKMLAKNKIIVSVLTLIFGICPTIIVWNATVLTESISILEMTVLAFITIKYLKKPSKIAAGLMGIVILVMILTRPAFIYLLPIYILFILLKWLLEKEERKKLIFAVISLLVCCMILVGYCFQVKRYYGIFNLTSVSGLNGFITAVYSGAYKDSSNTEMVKEIDKLIKGEEITQGRAFEIYNEIEKTHSQKEISEFANESIKNNDKYKNFIINKFIEMGSKNITTSYIHVQDDNGKIICNYSELGALILPITFGMIYILLVVGIIYLVWYIIKYKQINWICAFFTSTIFANIFTLIFGAPFEEQRLFFPSVCMVILSAGTILGKISVSKENFLNEKNIK